MEDFSTLRLTLVLPRETPARSRSSAGHIPPYSRIQADLCRSQGMYETEADVPISHFLFSHVSIWTHVPNSES